MAEAINVRKQIAMGKSPKVAEAQGRTPGFAKGGRIPPKKFAAMRGGRGGKPNC